MLDIFQGSQLNQKVWNLNRSTLGRVYSIIRGNLNYFWWCLRHRDATFSSYYAYAVTQKLDQGKPHRTLGKKRRGPKNFLTSGEHLNPCNAQKRGRSVFKKILQLGLQPHHVCVDYGCGSLRIGQHLIGYLERNHYCGVDVTDRFFRDGLALIDDGIIQSKTPHLWVIDDRVLQQLALLKVDYIISVAVLMHVPPNELDPFFDKLMGLMADHSRVLLFFDESLSTIRTAAKSWAHDVANLTEHIRRRNPDAQVSCTTGPIKGRIARSEIRRSVMIIEGQQEARQALSQKHQTSLISNRVPIGGWNQGSAQ